MSEDQRLRIQLLNAHRYLAHGRTCLARGEKPTSAQCNCGLRGVAERIQLEVIEMRLRQRRSAA